MKNTISELYKFYDIFNGVLFNESLGDCVITVQTRGRKKGVLGWFSKGKIWHRGEEQLHEINITTESLSKDKYEILGTLLHEMCHLYNSNQGIDDCSKAGNHKETFRECAEMHGLNCDKAKKIGWSVTSLTEETKAIIDEIGISEDAFLVNLGVEEEKEKEDKPKKPSKTYTCPHCGTSFKTKKELNIICGECNQPFEMIEE